MAFHYVYSTCSPPLWGKVKCICISLVVVPPVLPPGLVHGVHKQTQLSKLLGEQCQNFVLLLILTWTKCLAKNVLILLQDGKKQNIRILRTHLMSVILPPKFQLAQRQYEGWQPFVSVGQWKHKPCGRKTYWETKHKEGRRATENEHPLHAGSAKRLCSPVVQMWYFLTVAYLLGARTVQT